jgi:GMP synthase-like glutamine amidotransferase
VRVGIVANTEDPEAGHVAERLEAHGASFVRRWRDDPASLGDFERSVDLLVLLGSDWSVYDPAFAAPVAAERDLVSRATAAGCPTLGICFGGQLIASALGLTVERAPLGEIGWHVIESDEPELFGAGPWFQYHLDRWVDDPSRGAIARSVRGPQALIERRTLGVQFHPEVTADVIERWVRSGGADLARVGADADAIITETEREIGRSRAHCHTLVDAFLDRVASRPLATASTE